MKIHAHKIESKNLSYSLLHKKKTQPSLTSRQRLQAALEHQPVDKLCVDFGAGGQTGIGCCAVHRLREEVLGSSDHKVKVTEP